jgi:phosphoribosylanthranilate isomerase
MKIKVCGMKDQENIEAISQLEVDYLGFIFYKASPRYAETPVHLPENVQKVGVFVNETQESILEKVKQFGLDIIQLHGHETPSFCEDISEALAKNGYPKVELWKVFSIKTAEDFKGMEAYSFYVNKYLLDTKGEYRGGNGQKFDWQMLYQRDFSKPVMLSGGIGPEDAKAVVKLYQDGVIEGVDVNSGFEDKPGFKNKTAINKFIKTIRTYEQV